MERTKKVAALAGWGNGESPRAGRGAEGAVGGGGDGDGEAFGGAGDGEGGRAGGKGAGLIGGGLTDAAGCMASPPCSRMTTGGQGRRV